MSRTLCCLACLLLLGDFARAQDTREAKGPVIVLDFKGGFRVAPKPGEVEKPDMLIHADGKVVVNRNAGYRDQLSGEQLRSLLIFVVKEKKFFEFDEAKVKQKIAAAKDKAQRDGKPLLVPRIADAPTLHLTVRDGDRKAEHKYYAIDLDARVYKDIEELQNFLAIKNRLLAVMQNAVKKAGAGAGN